MFERTKTLYDVATNPKRYRSDDGDETEFDTVADPKTWRDQTKPTWRERLANRRHQLLSLGFLGFVVLGILAAYSRTFMPGLYNNPILKAGLKYGGIVSVTFLLGARWQRGQLKQVATIPLMVPKDEDEMGIKPYFGTLDTDSAGNTIVTFLKGFTFLGTPGEPLTLKELPKDLQQQYAKNNRDPNDPATIRLEDAMTGTDDTVLGPIAAVLTSGLKEDEHGRESDAYTAPPELAPKDKYRDLTKTLEKVYVKNAELQSRIDALKDERDHWREKAQEDQRKAIDEFIEDHGELAESGFVPRGGGMGQGGQQAMIPRPPAPENGSGGND